MKKSCVLAISGSTFRFKVAMLHSPSLLIGANRPQAVTLNMLICMQRNHPCLKSATGRKVLYVKYEVTCLIKVRKFDDSLL